MEQPNLPSAPEAVGQIEKTMYLQEDGRDRGVREAEKEGRKKSKKEALLCTEHLILISTL